MSKSRDSRNEKKNKKKPGTKYHDIKSTRAALKKSAHQTSFADQMKAAKKEEDDS